MDSTIWTAFPNTGFKTESGTGLNTPVNPITIVIPPTMDGDLLSALGGSQQDNSLRALFPSSRSGFYMGGDMEHRKTRNIGIKRLIEKHKASFRIPENINHYSDKDYHVAEKKFIKFALKKGKV